MQGIVISFHSVSVSSCDQQKIAKLARNFVELPFVYTRDLDIFGSHVKGFPSYFSKIMPKV